MKPQVKNFDSRRNLLILGEKPETIEYCAEQIIELACRSISEKGAFYIALSGGSTPSAIYALLASDKYKNSIDWQKVYLFWSDERAVPASSPESNFHMSMTSGLDKLPLNKSKIYRMVAEENIAANALKYETIIKQTVPGAQFDLVMLGVGEDGHTASLFPDTTALSSDQRLVVENFVPQKSSWRMTFTFQCINQAKLSIIYCLGASKAQIVQETLKVDLISENYPVTNVGVKTNKALWILDQAASQLINQK